MAKTADAAIEAMKQGAYDYPFKPLDPQRLQQVVGEALEVGRRMRQPAVVTEGAPDPDVDGAMVGSCPAMGEVYKAIGRVAAQDVPVLITGESGTGKELVARAVYQHSPRGKAPFLALNCAAIPENLIESEMFGHEKGAFTGADRRRIGKFSSATAVPFSSTRSATCRWRCRPKCCASSRSRLSSPSAGTRRFGPTCGSLLLHTAT
jgi:two-component system nitrogen regulation response regulator GlnG